MKKIIMLSIFVFYNVVAIADSSGNKYVSTVWQYTEQDGFIYLEDSQCPEPDYNYYRVDSNSSQHKTVMSIFMTALVSNKKVTVGYNRSNGHCWVTSVKLHR